MVRYTLEFIPTTINIASIPMIAAFFCRSVSTIVNAGNGSLTSHGHFYNDKSSAVSTYVAIPCFPHNSKRILLDDAPISFIIAWGGPVECFFLHAIQLA